MKTQSCFHFTRPTSLINGKSQLFSRPVLIFKKLSSTTFLGIPTTTQDKSGTWYVQVTMHKQHNTMILSQARVLDYKRLSNKIGHLDTFDYKKVKLAFKKLFVGEK